MEAIILFSHGSVLCGAEQNLLAIAETMERRGDAPTVRAGFLNYSSPSFEEALEACVTRGAQTIHVAPYFLVEGKFVTEELPGRITTARERFPDVLIHVGRPLADDHRLAHAIIEAAGEPRPTSHWRSTVSQVERFCRDSPRCPLHGSNDCPATRGRLQARA